MKLTKKLEISRNACFENPVQVFVQTGENFTQNANKNTLT